MVARLFLAKKDLNTFIFSNFFLIYIFLKYYLIDLGGYNHLIISKLQAVRGVFRHSKGSF